jgi:preprotein translocase subunit SecA
MRRDTIGGFVKRHLPPKAYAEQWDVEGLDERVKEVLGLELPIKDWASEEGIANEEIEQRIVQAADARAVEREALITAQHMRGVEKNFLLQMIDMQWREHLMHLDHLRNVIGLRGYGQRDPLNEYKTEAFSLFDELLTGLRQGVTRLCMTVEFRFEEPPPLDIKPRGDFLEVHMDPTTGENEAAMAAAAGANVLSDQQRQGLPFAALPSGWERTGRNAPCPCGSGKKFKHCHGAI